MKKLLLTMACALAVCAASAGEITDDFAVALKDAFTEPTDPKVSDNGVTYTFTNSSRNNNNALMMTTEGASFTAMLPVGCEKIVLNGADNTGVGKAAQITLSVGDDKVETVTVDADNKNFTFVIPDKYREAGTVYTFTRVGGNNRIATVTYTTIDKESWPAPEFNIPENSYVLNGQTIAVTNVPEGATVALSYKVGNKGDVNDVEGDSFEINITSGTTYRVFVTATISGDGKESATSVLSVTWSNGRRPVIADFKYEDIAYDGNVTSFIYTMGIVNRGKNTAPIDVIVTIFKGETLVGEYKNSTNNIIDEESQPDTEVMSLFAAETVSPLEPEYITRSVEVPNLESGDYTFTIAYNYNNGNPVQYDLGNNNVFTIGDGILTGIEDVEAVTAEAVYYNMQGLRVENPRHGQILVRILNGKASKIIF